MLSYDFDGSDVLELEYEEFHSHFEKLIDDDAKSELWEIIKGIQGTATCFGFTFACC